MKLDERKNGLLSILKTKHIDGHIDSKHKEILNIANKNVWILSRFGGQTVLNGSRKMIQTIRSTHIDKILYQGIKVDFFAIPSWGLDNKTGKNQEKSDRWCFIKSSDIYKSIKIYKDNSEELWTTNPPKNWKANVNTNFFYWKSDARKYKLQIEWDNYKVFDAEEYYSIDDVKALEGYKQDRMILSTYRNKKIADERKKQDKYVCQVCEFFLNISNSFVIECHHLSPLSENNDVETTINDLISLCPTCHRVAHLRKPPYTPNEIKSIIKNTT